MEGSFFDAAPAEEQQTLVGVPCFDDVSTSAPQPPRRETVGWRFAQRAWRRAAVALAELVAALSIWRLDQRRVANAFVGAMLATGLSAGIVTLRTGASTKDVTAQREKPVSGPTIAEAAPRSDLGSSAGAQAPPAGVSKRRPHVRRTTWVREGRSTPARSSRPFFSR